jgi:hypothetical protein
MLLSQVRMQSRCELEAFPFPIKVEYFMIGKKAAQKGQHVDKHDKQRLSLSPKASQTKGS